MAATRRPRDDRQSPPPAPAADADRRFAALHAAERTRRPRPAAAQPPAARLRRHVALVIAAKLVLLALIYAFFFSPSHRPAVDAGAVEQRILSPR